MKLFICFVAALLSGSAVVWAQQKGVPGKDMAAMDKPLPPSQYSDKPLPEMKGVVSWKTLAEVTPVRQKDCFVPQFSKEINALDKKEVKLQGFMMPLDMGEKQKRFLKDDDKALCTALPLRASAAGRAARRADALGLAPRQPTPGAQASR